MKPTKHFCTCEDFTCKLHPSNHSKGCDPCIQKNLAAGEIPTCFFKSVDPDISRVTDFTTQDFVEHFIKHRKK